jgi:DNA-binding transcriptional regulator YbjK
VHSFKKKFFRQKFIASLSITLILDWREMMSNTLNQFVETVTIRARVAYVLGVAEHIITDIKSDYEGYLLANDAIKTAWAWQNNASVSADVLNEYLMNEDEEGLLIHEQEADEIMVSAWVG